MSKTKEWYKNQLVTHGLPLPSSAAKKEEYQRLYEEQVLPKQKNTEFSSDDDTEEPSVQESPVRAPSVNNSRSQNGADEHDDKHANWVQKLSDANLFTALKANGRDVGGIVESTRQLYRKLLLDMLKKDERKTLSEIEVYLTENQEAKNSWKENGAELLNGSFNGVTNGNSENGYSDSDDDEALETASRASRSSRASSRRVTPIRSTAAAPLAKESTPSSPRTVVDSSKSRRGVPRDEVLMEDINEVGDDQGVATASSSRSTPFSEPAIYNRVSSLSSDSQRFSRPFSVRKTFVEETVEKTHTHQYYDGESSDDVTADSSHRSSRATATGASKTGAASLIKYLLLFIIVVSAPIIAYYIMDIYQNSIANCEGSDCSTDELDAIIQSLDPTANEDFVQTQGGA